MVKKIVLPLAALALSAFVAGCFESNKPLGDAGSVPFDPAVLGKWTCVPDPPLRPQDKATLTVRNVDQSLYDATWVDDGKTQRFRAHGTKHDATVVINVLEVAPHAKWFFLRYKREGSKLVLSVADVQSIKGGYEARKMDDLKSRVADDTLFKVVANCSRGGR